MVFIAQEIISIFEKSLEVPVIVIIVLYIIVAHMFIYGFKIYKMSDSYFKEEIVSLKNNIKKLEEEKAYLIGVIELHDANDN